MSGGDTTIPMRFAGNGSDLERAIASLEKRYQDLTTKMSEGASKAKSAAMAAKEAAKQAADGAEKSRKVYHDTVAQLEKEHRREIASNERKAERNKAIAHKEANESRRVFQQEIARLAREEKEASREHNRLVHQDANESRRVYRETTRQLAREERERINAAKAAAREKKRIEREHARQDARMQQWAGSAMSVFAGYVSISTILSTIISQSEKIIEQADEWGNKQDKLSRAFAVQAGLTALGGKQAQANINAEALRAGVPIEQASKAAKQLVSSGFNAEEAQGSALRELLNAQAAAGDQEGDGEKFALAISQLMSAANLDKTGENIKQVGQSMYALKKSGNLEVSDMEFIAPKIQGFIAQGSSWQEALATFTAMKDSDNRENAATGSKIMWQRLMGANGRKIGKHLKAIGLDPEEVDYIGESQLEVVDRINKAINALPIEKRQPAIQNIFGTDKAASIQGFLAHAERYKQLMEEQKNVAGYEGAIQTMQSGPAAAANRGQIKKEIQISEKKDDTSLILDELEYLLREQGYMEAKIYGRRMFANMSRNFGGKTEDAARYMLDYGDDETYFQALENVRQQKRGEPLTGISKWSLEGLNKRFPVAVEEVPNQQPPGEPRRRADGGVRALPDEPIPVEPRVPLLPGGKETLQDVAQLPHSDDSAARTHEEIANRGNPGRPGPVVKAFRDEPRETPQPVIPPEGKPTPEQEYDAWLKRQYSEHAQQKQDGQSSANSDPILQLVAEVKTGNDLMRENNDLLRSEKTKPAEPPKRPKPVSNASE